MQTNVTTWERMLRMLVGAVLVVAGAVLMLAADAFGYRALGGAGILLGLDLFVTGAIGFCPLYYALGGRHPAAR